MKDYLFEIVDEESDACGEQFFVECYNLETAWEIVQENFCEEVQYLGEYSVAEAEMWGLDTY
jgi:hypothetical protein